MSCVDLPKGWALCNGQLLPINQIQALFALLGTNFGGDGRVTFALPNLQGQVPIHTGNGHTLAETGGGQNHTLTIAQIPTHTHSLGASPNTGSITNPNGTVLSKAPANAYGT